MDNIEPVFDTKAFFDLSYTVLRGNSDTTASKITVLWKLSTTRPPLSTLFDRRPSPVSHWASMFVYNAVGVTQRIARVHLHQLNLYEKCMSCVRLNLTVRGL